MLLYLGARLFLPMVRNYPSGTTKSSALTIFAAYLTLSTLHPLFKQPLVQQVFRAGILLSLHVTQVLALAFRS